MGLRKGERIDELYSLGIKVIQNSRIASFSNDAILLAYFSRMRRNPRSITVDLCSGNGAVGLFVSQKTQGQVVEIEIQPQLAEMARRSVKVNHLTDQVHVIQADLANAGHFISSGSVDVITCNPPYFPGAMTSRQNPNPYLAIARHEIKTNLTSVIKTTSQLLKSHGHAFFVYRPRRLLEMLDVMQKYGLMPKRLQFAYSHYGDNANLVLIDAAKHGHERGLQILPPIIVQSQNNSGYSKQMKRIMFSKWQ